MFERFTIEARRVVVSAQEQARRLNCPHISTGHLLLALLKEDEGEAAAALAQHGITFDQAQAKLVALSRPNALPTSGGLPFLPSTKRALELAFRSSLQLGHKHIGTEHLLLGILQVDDSDAATVLNELNVEPAQLMQTILGLLIDARTDESATNEELKQSVIKFDFEPALCVYVADAILTLIRYSGDPNELPIGALYGALTEDEEKIELSYGDTTEALVWFTSVRVTLRIVDERVIVFFDSLSEQVEAWAAKLTP